MKFSNIQKIKTWINNTAYPPARIYAGMPQGKQERSAVKLCEELYSLTYAPPKRHILGDLRSSWRELEVSLKMIESMKSPNIRMDYFYSQCDKFIAEAKNSIAAMDKLFKQHQDLNGYYKEWRMSFQDIKSVVDKIKFDMGVHNGSGN